MLRFTTIRSSARAASTGRRERTCDPRRRIGHAVQAGEERQVLGGREVAVEKEIVAEHANPGSQRVTNFTREFAAVPDLA